MNSKLRQAIKEVLVQLAVDDELPTDMNALDPSVFDNVICQFNNYFTNFKRYKHAGNEAHLTELNFTELWDLHKSLAKAVRKFLKATVGDTVYILHYVQSQEGHDILKIGPEGVMYEDTNRWSDKEFKGLGIYNMLSIINNILEKRAKPESKAVNVMDYLHEDRSYIVEVDGMNAAMLNKGKELQERLNVLLTDQFMTECKIIDALRRTDEKFTIDLVVTFWTEAGGETTSTVSLTPAPLY